MAPLAILLRKTPVPRLAPRLEDVVERAEGDLDRSGSPIELRPQLGEGALEQEHVEEKRELGPALGQERRAAGRLEIAAQERGRAPRVPLLRPRFGRLAVPGAHDRLV